MEEEKLLDKDTDLLEVAEEEEILLDKSIELMEVADDDDVEDEEDDDDDMHAEEEQDDEGVEKISTTKIDDKDEMNIEDNLIEYVVEKLNDDESEETIIEDNQTKKFTSKSININEYKNQKLIAKEQTVSVPAKTTSAVQIKIGTKPTPITTKFAGIKSGNSGGGKIVFIQGSKTQQKPTTTISSGHGFQLLKTSDGNIIQIRNKNTTNSVPTNTIKKIVPQTQNINQNTIGKFIYKGISGSGNEQQILLATQPTKTTTIPSTTPTTKTISFSQAQQLGILSSAKMKQLLAQKPKLQLIKPATKIVPVLKSTTTPTIAPTKHVTPTNVLKKVFPIQPKLPTSSQQQSIAPQQVKKPMYQNLIKVQTNNNSASTVQAVNIPGKGVQYIRFVNISGTTSATTPTTTTTTSASSGTSASSKIISPSKIKYSVPQQKFVIQNKSGQTTTKIMRMSPVYSSITKTTKPTSSASAATIKSMMQTITTQKRLFQFGKNTTTAGGGNSQENSPKLIAVVQKEDGGNKLNMEKSGQKLKTLTQLQLSHLQGTSVIPSNDKSPPIVMLPANFIQQLQQKNLKRKEEHYEIQSQSPSPPQTIKIKKENAEDSDLDDEFVNIKLSPSSDGLRRKPCNCTKSQCLKLYCDCFANGEFCQNCNCKKCYNNLENEEERQKATKLCLERNPNAFRPKIGKAKDHNESFRRHNKGCNCKRSGCLKNYCECYEAKISCSENCKCFDCRNTDDYVERESGLNMSDPQHLRSLKLSNDLDNSDLAPNKQPYNFMTPDVIDATIQCMIAQADECQRTGIPVKCAEKMILEEFGRCLVEIIDFSIRNTDND